MVCRQRASQVLFYCKVRVHKVLSCLQDSGFVDNDVLEVNSKTGLSPHTMQASIPTVPTQLSLLRYHCIRYRRSYELPFSPDTLYARLLSVFHNAHCRSPQNMRRRAGENGKNWELAQMTLRRFSQIRGRRLRTAAPWRWAYVRAVTLDPSE